MKGMVEGLGILYNRIVAMELILLLTQPF